MKDMNLARNTYGNSRDTLLVSGGVNPARHTILNQRDDSNSRYALYQCEARLFSN